jgi:phosphatidate phosphatase APP1
MINSLLKGAYRLDQKFEKVRWSYIRKHNRIGPLKIAAYRGFGDNTRAYISGRLFEDRNILPSRQQDTLWRNLVAMYKRFETNEVPGALIQADFMGDLYEAYTDDEGYFEFFMKVPDLIDKDEIWHHVTFTLLENIGRNSGPVTATGQLKIPTDKAEYGIISDVDDTVIKTEATSFIRMMKHTFTRNASTRLPFEGVAAFYRALHMGEKIDQFKNPLYYVSSSPWNLYDMLEEFWELNEIPAGPFMLRDLGISEDKFIKTNHLKHKLEQIEKILSYTGNLPFILIGDSGQKDPEIYERVVADFPGRIKAIYIRDVTRNRRDAQVIKISERLSSNGVEMVFTPDTEMAARHALEKGYILQDYIKEILREKAKDQDKL